jgi:hypothetical protein
LLNAKERFADKKNKENRSLYRHFYRGEQMNEQEIRAKALEIAAIIIGQDRAMSALDWGDRYHEFPNYNKLGKYEFLATLIERDILAGFPVQNEIKHIFESEGSQVDNDGLIALRKRLKP